MDKDRNQPEDDVLLGTGRTAEVYDLGEGNVLKLLLEGLPVHWIEHEALILESVSKVCPLAPRYYGTQKRDSRLGIVMERVNGRTALELIRTKPYQAPSIIRQLTRIQRSYKDIVVDGIPDGRDGFHAVLNGYDGLDDAGKNVLRRVIDRGTADKLCHGDFHPDNVIFDEHMEGKIIDWITAYRGEPASDAARSYYLIRHGKGSSSVEEKPLEKYLRRYLSWLYLKKRYPGRTLPGDFDGWHALVMVKRLNEGIDAEETYIRYKVRFLADRMKNKEL